MWLTRPELKFFRRMDRFRNRMDCYGIVDMYESKGIEQAREMSVFPPFGKREPTLIFNENGIEIFGKSVEPIVDKAVKETLATGKMVSGSSQTGKFSAHVIFGAKGNKYAFVCFRPKFERMPGPHFGFLHGTWKSLIVRLILMLVTTFALCYGLARYLTDPIIRLQKAARALAEGKLSHRIEGDMAGRQDELIDLARDFDLMAERVQGLLSTQRRLLGDISHELRTPLTRMNVALELARESADDETGEHLDRIERESQRLQELIGRIVTLVRIETGGDHFTSGSLELGALVKLIIGESQIEAKGRRCTIDMDIDDGCTVFGSRELLRRAIENVLRNALRHTPEGTAIEVSCKKKEKLIVIEVRDHGGGVKEEQLDKLFEPFYRCEEARERSRGGVGLGLAIVKRAMAFHSGLVIAENCEDGGLKVSLQLPTETSLLV